MESANVKVDEKFRIQERIVDYNLDDDDVTKPMNDEVFLETNTDLQNEGEPRNSSDSLVETRVEITNPTSRNNMIKNHPFEKTIKSKDKGIMK